MRPERMDPGVTNGMLVRNIVPSLYFAGNEERKKETKK